MVYRMGPSDNLDEQQLEQTLGEAADPNNEDGFFETVIDGISDAADWAIDGVETIWSSIF